MIIDVDKDGLISLVKGLPVDYNAMELPLVKKYGRYIGGFVDKWQWNYWAFTDKTEEEIYELYLTLKDIDNVCN